MKTYVITLLALLMIAGIAVAEKPALEKPDEIYQSNGRAAEVEPNDDFSTANELVAGDDKNAAIDPAAEVDFFAIAVTAGLPVEFETHGGDIGDTKMYLYDTDGVTELAYNDDGGVNWYSKITYDFTADGIYFVKVTGYNSSTVGTYILTATEGDAPCDIPVNNTCENALPLPIGTTFNMSTCGATNEYTTVSGGCTGYTSNGIDVVYYVDLVEDQQFSITATTDYDIVIYMVTDCADIENTCVAGSDNTIGDGFEEFVFDAGTNPGRYYMIFDGYSSTGLHGDWEITVDGVVATESTSFDSLKSMYR